MIILESVKEKSFTDSAGEQEQDGNEPAQTHRVVITMKLKLVSLVLGYFEEVIYEKGYYKKIVKLGIEGQYWEFDKIYGVKKKLQIG